MPYEAKKFDSLVGIRGLSEAMLKNHFTLYEGYVKNVNTLVDLSKTLKVGSPEYNELRRRFGWEWNGMKMHEIFFATLTKVPASITAGCEFEKAMISSFGSYENWLADFKALCLTRGIGWAALVKDKATGGLMNIWIGEHEVGHLAGTEILLAVDVWEHAYLADYGIKRADYVEKIIPLIDWAVVESRYK